MNLVKRLGEEWSEQVHQGSDKERSEGRSCLKYITSNWLLPWPVRSVILWGTQNGHCHWDTYDVYVGDVRPAFKSKYPFERGMCSFAYIQNEKVESCVEVIYVWPLLERAQQDLSSSDVRPCDEMTTLTQNQYLKHVTALFLQRDWLSYSSMKAGVNRTPSFSCLTLFCLAQPRSYLTDPAHSHPFVVNIRLALGVNATQKKEVGVAETLINGSKLPRSLFPFSWLLCSPHN